MGSDKKNYNIKEGVSITEEVIAIIAGLAATEIDGVDSLAGSLKSEIIAKAGMKKLSKGIRVEAKDEENIQIKMALNITYGHDILHVSEQVQEKVKTAIENMTGLTVRHVDIRIASVTTEA